MMAWSTDLLDSDGMQSAAVIAEYLIYNTPVGRHDTGITRLKREHGP